MTTEEFNTFVADNAEDETERDYFNRIAFATRIADSLARQSDPRCIVVGIYGVWGEGKTTVLNYVQRSLDKSKTIAFPFNPWYFDSPQELIRAFFQELAAVVDKSLTSTKERLGSVLKTYGPLLNPFLGDGAQQMGENLAQTTLVELKTRVENILADTKKRIVVIMDDIDRLDKDEIQAVFRLVKLTADFSHMAYILAFDEEMVAQALGEKYGGERAGKSFLEKIIQIPLHLPSTDVGTLRKYCLDSILQCLKDV